MIYNYIILYLGTLIITVTVILGFIISKKYVFEKYMVNIKYFSLIGIMLSINSIIYFHSNKNDNSYFLLRQSLLYTIQFFFLNLSLIELQNQNRNKQKLKWGLSFISIILFIYSYLRFRFSIPLPIQILGTPLTLILCLLYFTDLLKSNSKLFLSKSPKFWIAFGSFFQITVSLPATVFSAILRVLENIEHYNILVATSNITIILFYLTIIKAYSCLKHIQNLS